MTIQIELFINLTLVIYLLFLLLPYIELIIDFLGKSITTIIKYFVKTFIMLYTSLLFFVWLMILGTLIGESLNFYTNNNNKINYENMKNITMYSFDKIFWKTNNLK